MKTEMNLNQKVKNIQLLKIGEWIVASVKFPIINNIEKFYSVLLIFACSSRHPTNPNVQTKERVGLRGQRHDAGPDEGSKNRDKSLNKFPLVTIFKSFRRYAE